jgi:hypothetical protein
MFADEWKPLLTLPTRNMNISLVKTNDIASYFRSRTIPSASSSVCTEAESDSRLYGASNLFLTVESTV